VAELIQHPILTKLTKKNDRKKNHDRSKKADIKIVAIKDKNEEAARKVLKQKEEIKLL
jgi:hypothetical protein